MKGITWQELDDSLKSKINEVETLSTELDSHKADDVRHFTTADRTKFAGIQAGAQVNTVTSVAGKTGAVTLVNSDVGLGNVQNYPIATQSQAQAGTSNDTYITPLRLKEAIVSQNTAKVIYGTYTGNGSQSRTISLGAEPILVILSYNQAYYYQDIALKNHGVYHDSNSTRHDQTKTTLGTTNFTTTLNTNGVTHYYVAVCR